MKYLRSNEKVSLDDFLRRAKKIKSFSSSSGKKYVISEINGDVISFKRTDSTRPNKEWPLDLKKVFEALQNLSDFKTESFREYVPIRHSPARGLLIHLGLLVEE